MGAKTFKNLALWALILVIAVVVVFYRFPVIPKNLAYDEVKQAILALSLKNIPYTVFSPLADGHPTLYFYIGLLSLSVFGITNFAFRFPSAIFGVVNVLIFTYILKIVFGKKSLFTIPFWFMLSIVFITLHWRLNFNRYSFEVSFMLFNEFMTVLFLLLATTEKKYNMIFFILTGIFAGLSMHSYHPGRIFFIVPVGFMFFKRVGWKNVLAFIIPLYIIAFPLLTYLIAHPSNDIRINQLAYFKNNKLSVSAKTSYFIEDGALITGMFFLKGDPNGRHNYPNKPAINPFLGLCLIGGFILSILFIKKPYSFLFLLILFVGVAPSLLVYPNENPSMLRTYGIIPAVIFFIGYALVWFTNKLNKTKRKIAAIFILVLLFVSCLYELQVYFLDQVVVFEDAFTMKNPLKIEIKNMLQTEHEEYKGYIIKL